MAYSDFSAHWVYKDLVTYQDLNQLGENDKVHTHDGTNTAGINSSVDVKIAATKKLYLDGGINTYISEVTGDEVGIITGGTEHLRVSGSNMGIAATGKFYLDGVACTGNTYIAEVVGDEVGIVTGGTEHLRVSGSNVGIMATGKLYLDGVASSGDTYILESGANQIDIYTGGTLALEILSTQDIALQATKKLYFDGGTNTYITEVSADQINMYTGGILGLAITSLQDVLLGTTKKLYLDGGGDTYIVESAANQIDVYTGGVLALEILSTQDVALQAAKKLYFDGGGDTYIWEGLANDMRYVIGGTDVMFMNVGYALLYISLLCSPGGGCNIGDGTSYWGDISYKTLTDRGCLGWFDTGVELQDGRKVSDTQALKEIKKHPTKKTVYGVPMLNYKTFPKVSYKKADNKGELLPRDENDEPIGGADGIEMTSMFSIMLGAIKELTLRVEALEK